MTEKKRILANLENDNSRPVLFSESHGGSESQLRLLFKHVPDEYFKDINLILNNANPSLIDKDRLNVLWMQHFVNQEEAKNLGSKNFVDQLDYVVFNSKHKIGELFVNQGFSSQGLVNSAVKVLFFLAGSRQRRAIRC